MSWGIRTRVAVDGLNTALGIDCAGGTEEHSHRQADFTLAPAEYYVLSQARHASRTQLAPSIVHSAPTPMDSDAFGADRNEADGATQKFPGQIDARNRDYAEGADGMPWRASRGDGEQKNGRDSNTHKAEPSADPDQRARHGPAAKDLPAAI
jgi:hypothetical protein